MDQNNLSIRDTDIPLCPACGSYLERNLRRDHHFVEAHHMERQTAYASFVNRSCAGKLLLIEIGVGFNTPSVIRWPFERIVSRHPQSTLIRINASDADVLCEINEQSISIQEDAAQALNGLINARV